VKVIIVYDIEEKRVNKVNKFLKRWLTWQQNSVFEGELSPSQLEELKVGLKEIIDENYDSIIIYEIDNPKNIKKEHMGAKKVEMDFII